MTTADQRVESAANKLQRLAHQLAAEGGLKAKLAQPLGEDADLIRKMKPSLIKARAKGRAAAPSVAPSRPELPPQPMADKSRGGPNPWLVVGLAFAAGVLLAKWIDWRGHAHPTA
jgi:hypothetical protein